MLSDEIAQRLLSINFQEIISNIFHIFSGNRIWQFMQIVSNRDSLHEISNHFVYKTIRKVSSNILPAENAQLRVVRVKETPKLVLHWATFQLKMAYLVFIE